MSPHVLWTSNNLKVLLYINENGMKYIQIISVIKCWDFAVFHIKLRYSDFLVEYINYINWHI